MSKPHSGSSGEMMGHGKTGMDTKGMSRSGSGMVHKSTHGGKMAMPKEMPKSPMMHGTGSKLSKQHYK